MNKLAEKLILKVYNIGLDQGVIKENHTLTNINLDLSKKQKKVLVAYLEYSSACERLRRGMTHTNQPRLFQIIKTFIDMGMIVDTCWCLDSKARENLDYESYDIIFGFGSVFQDACLANKRAIKIIYMTEDPFFIASAREKERIEYYTHRHPEQANNQGIKDFVSTRAGVFYPDGIENLADYVVCQGNPAHFERLGKKVYFIVPNAFKNEKFTNNQNHKQNNTFVMFGASSLIRKGTDILVDVFSQHPEWELYLCDKNISANLKKIGYSDLPSNVHDCGFIDVESDELIKLFEKVRFILLPSCSEAPSSAVLTGMRHGLLPIVMRGIGLDSYHEFCSYFEQFTVEHVESVISENLQQGEDCLNEKSEAIYKYANQNFTISAFTLRLKNIMLDIMGEEQR